MSYGKFFALLAGFAIAQTSTADSVLEYVVSESGAKVPLPQPIAIKDGKILLGNLGGDPKLDLLYSAAPQQLCVIDHKRHTVMTLDEAQINRLAKETEMLQPLLLGLGEQLTKLTPRQRAKWEQMLGGRIPLQAIAAAAQDQPAANLIKTGKDRNIAGFACKEIDVFQGRKKTSAFCLADPARLKISDSDYATIRSLLDFSERLNAKTHGLSKQFGVTIPALELANLNGVPIELRDVSGKNRGSIRLNRILTSDVSATAMQIPQDYQSEPFRFW